MVDDNTTRRRLLAAGTTTVLTWTAGCLGGDESVREIEAALDRTEVHLDEAEHLFDELEADFDAEDWHSCLDTTSEIPTALNNARREANHALDIATEEGHTQLVNVIELTLDLIDILEQMVDEAGPLCEAADEEDYEEVEARLETLEQLQQELIQTEQELDQAAQEFDG